eukprot:Hpha_TRINITY_DN16523_c7_g1::TRINITY_DN16523_c7_g1_i2::g.137065::m.137065
MAEFVAGDVVEAQLEDGWRPGTVKKVRENGTIDVVLDLAPGEEDDPPQTLKKLAPEQVRLPKKEKKSKKEKKAAAEDSPREEEAGEEAPTPKKKKKKDKEEPPPEEEAPAAEEVSPSKRSKKEKKEKKAKKEEEEDDDDDDAPFPKQHSETAGRSTQAQYEAEVAAKCLALRKAQPGVREFRCARWTVEEKLGVKFSGPEDLQIVYVSDGAAERFLDEDALGMTLTHVDGEPAKSVSDVRRLHGDKLAFRWTLVPCERPLGKLDPSRDMLTEKVFIPSTTEVDGKTQFILKVTRTLTPGHLGPPVKVEIPKRYSVEWCEGSDYSSKMPGFKRPPMDKCRGSVLTALAPLL